MTNSGAHDNIPSAGPDSALTSQTQALIVLRDAGLRDRLMASLPPGVSGVLATLDEACLAAAEYRPGTVVFADLDSADALFAHLMDPPPPPGPGAAGAQGGRCPFIFITGDDNPEAYFDKVARYNIQWFFHPFYIDNLPMLTALVENATGGPGTLGLHAYFDQTQTRQRELVCAEDRARLIDTIVDEVATVFLDGDKIFEQRMALEEMLDNAIHHAFEDMERDPDQAPPLPHVVVEYVVDPTVFAFSVIDNGGRLTGERVIQDILRQITREGLFESGGRGVFLTFSFSNIFILNTIPDNSTQVTIMFFRDCPPARKMFQLNTSRDV